MRKTVGVIISRTRQTVTLRFFALNSFAYLGKEPVLLTATDCYKDQTFFLSTLNSNQLTRSMFPVGGLMKTDVKKIAEENGFCDLAKKQEVIKFQKIV